MADVAHTIPTSVTYLGGSEFGFVRPGIQVTPFISGHYLTRDWHGFNVIQYDLAPALFNSSDDTLEEWEAFWHQIDGGASAGYIVSPISGTHRDLICGGFADGSKSTFPIPVLAPTAITVYTDTSPSVAGTTHTAANLLTDAFASCGDADDFDSANATDAASTGVSLDGLVSIKVTPSGGANPSLSQDVTTSGLSAAEEYTGLAWVLCTKATAQNYRVIITWYESDGSLISSETGSDVSIAASNGWTAVTATGTSPALTTKGAVFLQRNDTAGTDDFYVDCFALNPGDYDRWHLPSQSPGLIECSSAPTDGSRLYATATGQRVTRCRFEHGTRWSMSSPGHASVRSIRATEWIEF